MGAQNCTKIRPQVAEQSGLSSGVGVRSQDRSRCEGVVGAASSASTLAAGTLADAELLVEHVEDELNGLCIWDNTCVVVLSTKNPLKFGAQSRLKVVESAQATHVADSTSERLWASLAVVCGAPTDCACGCVVRSAGVM